MNPFPPILSRVIRSVRTIRIIPSRETCPRCIWDYTTKPELCQRCRKNRHRDTKDSTEDEERCEQYGEIVSPGFTNGKPHLRGGRV